MSTDQNILVTGASGLVGNHLVQLLSGKGERVRALYHSSPSEKLQKLPNVEWVQCDLLDVEAIEEVMKGIDEVYHCAAIVSFEKADAKSIMHFNIESTSNIVNEALIAGVRKLVYASSIAALGRNNIEHEITEEQQWEEGRGNSVYAQSKYYAELEVWRGMAEGLDAAIVNPGIILGEGNWEKGSARLLKVADKEFPYYTEGVTSWVDVKDVSKAMYRLMKSDIKEERFILSAGNYSYREIFTLMAEGLGKKPPHKKAGKLMSGLVWRYSAVKKLLIGRASTITRESAATAQRKVYYNNQKLINSLSGFGYTPIQQTINRVANAYKTQKKRNF